MSLQAIVIPAGPVSGTWTPANNPYQIDGNISVAATETLELLPGVVVEFNSLYSLDVAGKILAVGTQTDSIKFTAPNSAQGWQGIRFTDTTNNGLGNSQFAYCLFKTGAAIGAGELANGGAIFATGSANIQIDHCLFQANYSAWDGGAICLKAASDVTITNSLFTLNSCGFYGGSICTYGSAPLIDNCIFKNNSSSVFGAGISSWDASAPVIQNSMFIGNSAGACTGIYAVNSAPVMVNLLFNGQTTTFGSGAAVGLTTCDAHASNLTMYNNVSPLSGGAFWVNGGTLNVSNSIMWNNQPEEIFELNSGVATVSNCVVDGGFTGNAVITEDPEFTDPSNSDLTLLPGSPCVDAGDETAFGFTIPATDLAGNARVQDGDGDGVAVIDMGCYEVPGGTTPSNNPPQNLAVTELGFATWEAPQTGGGANEFFDDFESGLGNWNVINNGGVGEWMVYGDPYPNSYTMPPASSGNVCAADADEAGSGSTTDTDLVLAAPLDLSGLTTVILEFDSDFNALDADDHCYVDVSNDGGTNWENVLSYLGDDVRETHETIDISAQAAGSSNVLLRFRSVQPGWDWFWVIDNVAVHGPAADNTRDLVGYNVYLDGTFIEMVTALEYQYTGLEAGTTYTAGVSALYDDGESDVVTADFTYPTPQTNPPENLVADINDYNDVTLTWDQPGGTGGLLAYHTGYDANGIGTGGAVDFSCAARFTAAELADFYGNAITNVRMVIHSADFSGVTVKVWEGGSYGDPGTEVYSADVTSSVVAGDWTDHALTTAVTLVDGNEYWIGYEINATGDHPAAVDAGPMVADKGSWMYFNGAWDLLTNLGATLDFNWCIEGVVGPATAAANTPVALTATKPVVINNALQLKADHESGSQHASSTETTRALTGYKVYRDGSMIHEITDPTITTYSDMGLDAGSYAYHVTAVYDDGESDPSNTENVTIVLPAPAGFNAVSQGPAQSTIMCTWSAPAATRNLSEYKIYRDGTEIGSTTGLFYADLNLPSGEYTYHVTAIYSDTYESDASNAVTVQHTDAPTPLIPTVTALNGNYPNPFNPTTEVKFSLNEAAEVNIIVFNIKGEKVKTLVNGHMEAAFHTVTWNGDDENGASVGSGVFFYRMATPGYTEVKKMILLK
jgi:hypothetical protein